MQIDIKPLKPQFNGRIEDIRTGSAEVVIIALGKEMRAPFQCMNAMLLCNADLHGGSGRSGMVHCIRDG